MRKLQLKGQKFERLTVISEILNDSGNSKWLCKCDCGKQVESIGWHLTAGKVKSCGCYRITNDRTGKKIGNWTVLSFAGNESWNCECKCGTRKIVPSSALYKKRSKSCGCYKSPPDEIYNERVKKRILKSIKINPNGCWDWQKYCCYNGYGTMTYRKRVGQRVSRVVYMLWKGPIPQGLFVCHSCDRPSCVNPDHLWLGTAKDNVQDMIKKNRQKKGKNHVK